MKWYQIVTTGAALALSLQVSAKPYVALQLGVPKVSDSVKAIDQSVTRLSLGYILNNTARFSVLGEIGAQTGLTYDAGKLGTYTDNVNVKIGSSLSGLLGVQFRSGRLNTQLVGGIQSMTVSTSVAEGQDTLTKNVPLAGLRFQYIYTPNVQFSVSIMHAFGKGGAVYSYNESADTVALNHEPSITTVLVGVQLAL